jgi:type VI protein secretion system component VasK
MAHQLSQVRGQWVSRAGLSLSDRLCLAHWAIVLCGLAAFAFDGDVRVVSLAVSMVLALVCMDLCRWQARHPRAMHQLRSASTVSIRRHVPSQCATAGLLALRQANRLSGAPPSASDRSTLCSQEVMADAIASFLLVGVSSI